MSKLLSVLTLHNILFGLFCIWLAIYGGYHLVLGPTIEPDILVYYTAAHILHSNPSALYDIAPYQDVYAQVKTLIIPKETVYFPYLCPPSFILFLYPLGWFSLATAYFIFSAINIGLLCVLALQLHTYLKATLLVKYTLFLQTLLLILFPLFEMLKQGQITLIICTLLMAFLIDIQAGRMQRAALWLALLTNTRPQYFITLWCVLAGQKRWSTLLPAAGVCVALFAISSVMFGTDIWEKYLLALAYFQRVFSTDQLKMINFSGILDNIIGNHTIVTTITRMSFMAVCLYAIVLGYFNRHSFLFPPLIAISLFFSPYMLLHDMLLFLPACLGMALLLWPHYKKAWLASCYLMATWVPVIILLVTGKILPYYHWLCQTLGATFALTAIYILHILQKSFSSRETVDSSRRNL